MIFFLISVVWRKAKENYFVFTLIGEKRVVKCLVELFWVMRVFFLSKLSIFHFERIFFFWKKHEISKESYYYIFVSFEYLNFTVDLHYTTLSVFFCARTEVASFSMPLAFDSTKQKIMRKMKMDFFVGWIFRGWWSTKFCKS